MLKAAFLVDYVVLGGGHSKKLEELPDGCRRGSNEMAYIGGVKMWEDETPPTNGHLEMARQRNRRCESRPAKARA